MTSTIVLIDHNVVLRIVKSNSLITTLINKLNFRLIRIFEYIQRFELELRHKLEKQHVVSNALSRLISTNFENNTSTKEELNALFITTLIEIDEDFRERIVKDYRNDLN